MGSIDQVLQFSVKSTPAFVAITCLNSLHS
ncbi:hypothetical protein CK203_062075 [Vitis vinifera]|uniref:Uncharacterized protein n=1 Tax=Vitis vinifera TaxID=29760 RepID=A0A438GBU8_VITVI|nr:hypothetical protein CK203_062075 [Vitis vinifera]